MLILEIKIGKVLDELGIDKSREITVNDVLDICYAKELARAQITAFLVLYILTLSWSSVWAKCIASIYNLLLLEYII